MSKRVVLSKNVTYQTIDSFSVSGACGLRLWAVG